MTGRRKSCKTCKKVAANSLPFTEMSVPVVDGVFHNNNDHKQNRTPGFRSFVADAISDPASAGTGVADTAPGRTEPTPGFRKTAKRKTAIQGSSFTAVAQQTTQQSGAAQDNEGAYDKDNSSASGETKNNSACGDRNDPKDAAGCSDQHASKAKVAASVASESADTHDTVTQAATTISGTDGIIPSVDAGQARQGRNYHKKSLSSESVGDAEQEKKNDPNYILKSVEYVFSCNKGENKGEKVFNFLGALQPLNKNLLEDVKKRFDKIGTKEYPTLKSFAIHVINTILRSSDVSLKVSLSPKSLTSVKLTKNGESIFTEWSEHKEYHNSWGKGLVVDLFKLIAEYRFFALVGSELVSPTLPPPFYQGVGADRTNHGANDKIKSAWPLPKQKIIGYVYFAVLDDMEYTTYAYTDETTKRTYHKLGGEYCSNKMTLHRDRYYAVTAVLSDYLYGTDQTEKVNDKYEDEELAKVGSQDDKKEGRGATADEQGKNKEEKVEQNKHQEEESPDEEDDRGD